MSLLSGLLKIGGAIAAPFTGGASLLATGLGAAGDIAGKAAGNMAKGREAENQQAMSRDQLLNQQYGIGQNAQFDAGQLDLQRKNFSEDARGGRAKQALIASILGGGFQPTSINVPGIKSAQVSGGLAESLKNPGGQQAMQELMKQALAAQMGGDTFEGGKILNAPQLSQPKKAGTLEKILGGVGMAGSLIGGINAATQRDPTASVPGLNYGSGISGSAPGTAIDPQSLLASVLKKTQQYADPTADESNR